MATLIDGYVEVEVVAPEDSDMAMAKANDVLAYMTRRANQLAKAGS